MSHKNLLGHLSHSSTFLHKKACSAATTYGANAIVTCGNLQSLTQPDAKC